MFWKRATGHGAFWGLMGGTAGAALTHGLTVAEGKGGWLLASGALPLHEFRSGMGQAFAISILAWTVCFVLTIAISLFTKPKKDEEMRGLVYSLTEKPKETEARWYLRPAALGTVVLVVTVALNFVFR